MRLKRAVAVAAAASLAGALGTLVVGPGAVAVAGTACPEGWEATINTPTPVFTPSENHYVINELDQNVGYTFSIQEKHTFSFSLSAEVSVESKALVFGKISAKVGGTLANSWETQVGRTLTVTPQSHQTLLVQYGAVMQHVSQVHILYRYQNCSTGLETDTTAEGPSVDAIRVSVVHDTPLSAYFHYITAPDAPASSSVSGSRAFVSGDEQHVFGRDTAGHLHHWYWGPDSGGVQQQDWGGSLAGDPVGFSYGDEQHVFGRDTAGHLHHWYWSPDSGGVQ